MKDYSTLRWTKRAGICSMVSSCFWTRDRELQGVAVWFGQQFQKRYCGSHTSQTFIPSSFVTITRSYLKWNQRGQHQWRHFARCLVSLTTSSNAPRRTEPPSRATARHTTYKQMDDERMNHDGHMDSRPAGDVLPDEARWWFLSDWITSWRQEPLFVPKFAFTAALQECAKSRSYSACTERGPATFRNGNARAK
jgi:hypothetical protein